MMFVLKESNRFIFYFIVRPLPHPGDDCRAGPAPSPSYETRYDKRGEILRGSAGRTMEWTKRTT